MSNIKLICDSLCDLPNDVIEKYNIDVVALSVLFDDREYTDGVDISKEDFYKLLRSSSHLPKTSQATYSKFKETFDKNKDKTILYIGGSSVASGTFQSAKLCISDHDYDIYAFDSLNLSIGTAQFVLMAAKMIEENKSIDEIMTKLNLSINDVSVLFSVDTLEYLQKGGRVSLAQASIGNLLNIKPILEVKDGTVKSLSKVRGKKNINSKLISLLKESFGYSIKNKTIIIGCGDNPLELEDFRNYLLNEVIDCKIITVNVGSCICAHSGPGIIGVSCL